MISICCLAGETYQQIDSEYLKVETGKYKDAGSTATIAILVGDRLLVANVGDSRAVISRAGKGEVKISNGSLFRNCFDSQYY